MQGSLPYCTVKFLLVLSYSVCLHLFFSPSSYILLQFSFPHPPLPYLLSHSSHGTRKVSNSTDKEDVLLGKRLPGSLLQAPPVFTMIIFKIHGTSLPPCNSWILASERENLLTTNNDFITTLMTQTIFESLWSFSCTSGTGAVGKCWKNVSYHPSVNPVVTYLASTFYSCGSESRPHIRIVF